ncbi:MAG TPA: DUF3347 domain-containing protein [Chitinophagaceae bacterium]|nr:DUF3347 domain-containing protein [Chitinophagaceae bacterium]
MKQLVISFLAMTALSFAACDNGSNQTSEKKDTISSDHMAMGSVNTTSIETVNAPVIKASFTNVSTDVTAHINEVLSHYFHVKHALTNDDAAEAKNGAGMLLRVISQYDNSSLPADQKAEYTKHITAIKEHADAIVKSADVEAERMHFSELSTHTYELVKAFGAGKKIYYDHCPMALGNKGANWLSESATIENPYMGKKMPECGSVEQVIE